MAISAAYCADWKRKIFTVRITLGKAHYNFGEISFDKALLSVAEGLRTNGIGVLSVSITLMHFT